MVDGGFSAFGVIERGLKEVEQGNPKAEPLSDVASSAEVSADSGNIVLDADGTFKIRRSSKKVLLPNDSKELRRRFRLLGHTFTNAKLQRLGPPRLGIELGRRRSPSLSSLAESSRGAAFGHLRVQELEGCHFRGMPLDRAPRRALYHAFPRERCAVLCSSWHGIR